MRKIIDFKKGCVSYVAILDFMDYILKFGVVVQKK